MGEDGPLKNNVDIYTYMLSGSYIYVQLFHFNCIEIYIYCNLSEITEPTHQSLRMLILDENFRWH